MVFNASVETLSYITEQKNVESKPTKTNEMKNKFGSENLKDQENIYKIQCFPLYSILIAINRTYIDYFSLDIEGAELKVLSTIPWHKVYIKVATVRNKQT